MNYIFKGINSAANYIFKGIKPWATVLTLKLFEHLYRRPWTGVSVIVHREAERIGIQMLKAWLVHHRMQHCARCLGLGTLRKTIVVENGQAIYLCEKCHKQGVDCGAAKPALDIVRP